MSIDCDTIYCDHCGKMSCKFDTLTYHDICFEEHELQPGPCDSPGSQYGEQGMFVQLAEWTNDYPTHEHWCIQCWNKLTDVPKANPKVRRWRLSTVWDRVLSEDPLNPQGGVVEVADDEPEIPRSQRPDWNLNMHHRWADHHKPAG